MAQHPHSQDAWTRARDRFVEDLSETEKQMYYQGSLETIYYDASAAKNRHENTSKSKHLIDKLQPLVSAIDQYSEAVDVYSNAYPLALSPLWGSLRIVLHLAREFGKYFEKVLDMFEQIGQVIPRFRAYEELFPDNQRLVHLISIIYVDILAFCSEIKAQFRHGKRAAASNLSLFLKLAWKPIDVQFARYMRKFRDHERNVEKQAKLAGMLESDESRALVKANHLQLEKEKKENERQAMLSKLCMVSNKKFHLKQRQMYYEGTGRWALQSLTYVNWKSKTGHRGLCCYGIPGCGKSVLTSTIVEDLQSHENSAHHVIYYYCSHADARSTETTQILGGFLKQLILDGIVPSANQEELLNILRKDEDHDRKERLAKLVRSTILSLPIAFLVLDGLDECKSETQRFMVKFLDELVNNHGSEIRILVTCRDESQTLGVVEYWPKIMLSETAIADDVRRFVSFSVRSSVERGDLVLSEAALEEEIVTVLTTKAHGMFLWVHFQLIELCNTIASSQIRAALQGLPDGLGDTYERILTRIHTSELHWSMAKRIFHWLACARRPLELEEMQEAVAFDSSDKHWDAAKIPNKSSLLKICQGLVVQGQDGIVQFAHHTVQQYLFAPSNLSPFDILTSRSPEQQDPSHRHCFFMETAEDNAANLCITYLNFSDFGTEVAPQVQDARFAQNSILGPGGPGAIAGSLGLGKPVFNAIYRVMGRSSRPAALDIDYGKYLNLKVGKTATAPDTKHRLLSYIVENWPKHVRYGSLIPAQRYQDLLVYKTLPFEFRPWGSNRHFGPYGCSFCSGINAAFALEPKHLILTSAMHWAAAEGNVDLLWYMSDFQISIPQYQPFKGSNSLGFHIGHERYNKETIGIACRMGHTRVVEFLLQQFGHYCWDKTLLIIAASAGHAETLKSLLTFCRDGDREIGDNIDDHIDDLLFKAATNGHVSVVKYLLNLVVNLDFQDDFTGMTALQSAFANGREEVILSLVEGGFDVDEPDASDSTALHLSARRGQLSMTTCLVEAGASLRLLNIVSMTPIDEAILARHSAITDYLLTRPSCETSIGRLRMLDEVHNARIEWENRAIRARTWATAFGHEASLISVLDQLDAEDSDVTYDIGDGLSLIHIAARYGNLTAISELLRRGLSPDTSTNDFCTPLHMAAYRGVGGTVGELLRQHADPKCATVHGWTPLHFAAISGIMEGLRCVELLCEHGADINASTNIEQGAMTPMHLLVSKRSDFRIVELMIACLVGRGVELKKCSKEGVTAFEMAMTREYLSHKTRRVLLQIEADSMDRPLLWHLAACIQDISSTSDLSSLGEFGHLASDYLSAGQFSEYDIIYAKSLIESAREAIDGISYAEDDPGDSRRRQLELIIFLLQQATSFGAAQFKVIPSPNSGSEDLIMDVPPNTPIEVSVTRTDFPKLGSAITYQILKEDITMKIPESSPTTYNRYSRGRVAKLPSTPHPSSRKQTNALIPYEIAAENLDL